ncbi:E3 ubiquitin-protein ligase MIB2-like [Pomacea canaliculata]|uniref:E3 ubiquitin-protein ligase MIB2-like n=1 Tax=Pomacea canaliculata TaxID=400727 RepID=UPI000D726056|nr:E3 ubiquitin-protein ligase MIB2-like [Pomacea canaliculata]
MECSSDEEEKETDDKERQLEVDVGDSVAIKVGESRLEELQKAHGGCTKEMKQAIGMTGRVVMKSTEGSVQVDFKSLGQYPFSPEALIKVSQVKQGDIVRIRSEKDQVKNLNHRVGWKDEMTLTLGKVGRVAKVDSDGDALVIFGRSAFLYSPACCIPEPDAQTDSLVVSKQIVHRTSPSTSEVKDSAVQEQNKALFLKMREMVLGQSSMSYIDQEDPVVRRLFDAIYVGDGETVARLCRKNKSLLASRHQRLTPIMLASTRHSLEVVELLLDLGADINTSIPPNKTALGAAIESKRDEIACLLIHRGAHLSYVDNNKSSYVHLAAYYDMATVIGLLVAQGADINAKDKDMDTPLLIAVQRGSHRAMEAFLSMSGIDVRTKNNRGFSALQLACQEGYAREVEKMLAIDKSGVNDFYHGVSTALHLAAMSDQTECVRLLVINGGANVNLHASGMMYNCPLHIACHMAKLQTVEALLELGADVNAQDSSGDTPLHLAIGGRINKDDESECQLRIVIGCMLIRKGAYVDARNKKGRHPFNYGSQLIREGIGRFIRQNKALVKSRYKNG